MKICELFVTRCDTMRDENKKQVCIAGITAIVLLSATLMIPFSNAYAESQNGNSKSNDNNVFSMFFAMLGNNLDISKGQTTDTNQLNQDIKALQQNIKDDRKELKDQQEDLHGKDICKPNDQGKYNKDCQEDQDGKPNDISQLKQEITQDQNQIKDDRKELKDQKEDNSKDKDKCKPNKQGKYNKDCQEDQGGN